METLRTWNVADFARGDGVRVNSIEVNPLDRRIMLLLADKSGLHPALATICATTGAVNVVDLHSVAHGTGLSVDARGNIYIGDFHNHIVHVFDSALRPTQRFWTANFEFVSLHSTQNTGVLLIGTIGGSRQVRRYARSGNLEWTWNAPFGVFTRERYNFLSAVETGGRTHIVEQSDSLRIIRLASKDGIYQGIDNLVDQPCSGQLTSFASPGPTPGTLLIGFHGLLVLARTGQSAKEVARLPVGAAFKVAASNRLVGYKSRASQGGAAVSLYVAPDWKEGVALAPSGLLASANVRA